MVIPKMNVSKIRKKKRGSILDTEEMENCYMTLEAAFKAMNNEEFIQKIG